MSDRRIGSESSATTAMPAAKRRDTRRAVFERRHEQREKAERDDEIERPRVGITLPTQ